MSELKTDFWASALIWRASIAGAFAGVTQKGDTDAGAVLVKVASLDGKARLYAPARDGEGERGAARHPSLRRSGHTARSSATVSATRMRIHAAGSAS
jgi:hypothetical protein